MQQGNFDFELNPYLNSVQNFIQLIPTGVETTNRGAFPVFEYEQVNALLYGIDAHATYDFYTKKPVRKMNSNPNEIIYNVEKLISLSTSFSYIYGNDTTNNEALIDMPPAQIQNDFTWYNVVDTGFDFQLTHQYVWQQSRFPDNDYEARVPLDDGTFETRTVQISQSPGAYGLWNAGISYAFAKARLSVTSNNIFNTSYRNYLNRQRFYADEVGRDIQIQFIYNL